MASPAASSRESRASVTGGVWLQFDRERERAHRNARRHPSTADCRRRARRRRNDQVEGVRHDAALGGHGVTEVSFEGQRSAMFPGASVHARIRRRCAWARSERSAEKGKPELVFGFVTSRSNWCAEATRVGPRRSRTRGAVPADPDGEWLEFRRCAPIAGAEWLLIEHRERAGARRAPRHRLVKLPAWRKRATRARGARWHSGKGVLSCRPRRSTEPCA